MFALCSLLASGIEGVDVVVADVNDQESLEALCSRASVLINCVGPVSCVCVYDKDSRKS